MMDNLMNRERRKMFRFKRVGDEGSNNEGNMMMIIGFLLCNLEEEESKVKIEMDSKNSNKKERKKRRKHNQ